MAFRSLRQFFSRDGREHLWSFLDALDARPRLRKGLLIGLPALIVAAAAGTWGYHEWSRDNSIRIARQWLDAGRLDRAGLALQDALASEPDNPAPWRLASELAWRMGNRAGSVEYARKAAVAGRYDDADVLAWGEGAILSDDAEGAVEAEAFLGPAAQSSPRALRLAGEVARRGGRFAEARDRFEAALRADVAAGNASPAMDEVPLGIVCLQTGSRDDGARGRALLGRWAPDFQWGVEALRALIADAVANGDPKAATWAEALRVHPRCTLGDIPTCLQAFARFDPPLYQTVLAGLEDKDAGSPNDAALLLGWLAQIGQAPEAVRWGKSLDPETARKPPIVVGVAEALRNTRSWADLRAWVDAGQWGSDLGFVGWGYGMVAARQLGDAARADSLWQTIYDNARASPAHALFLGDSLYAWGYPKESAALLWIASERADLAYRALGSLVRLYQVERDAAGQYRAFSRLNAMRPTDRRIANNYAYFAAVTGLGSQSQVERIAEDNFKSDPANVSFRSTYAFVLVWMGQSPQAIAILEPVSGEWRKSHAVAIAYGSALAGVGRRAEANEVLGSLDMRSLDPQEADWVRAALR